MKKLILLICFLFFSQIVSAQTTRVYNAYLRSNTGTHFLWDSVPIRIFGITSSLSESSKIPARTLYANQGDTVIINTRNISQNEHHTIHLHGLDVDTRNDGDPSTSFSLDHMQDTTYTFIAKYPGTYIYHCHVADVVHVQMGMYGLIVVNAAGGTKNAWTGGPAYNKDYKWLMSDIDKAWHDDIPVHDPITDTVSLPKYSPGYFLINGKSKQQLDDSIKISGSVSEKFFLRLANIGFVNNLVVFPSSLNATIIDSDGRPLPTALSRDSVILMPGERYGVMLTPTIEFTGTIDVNYVDPNTHLTLSTEIVPVNIEGTFGIKEQERNSLPLYPNPGDGELTIQFQQSDKTVLLEVISTPGIKVKSVTLENVGSQHTFNFQDLPSGTYLVRATTATRISSALFVVTK